MRFRICNRPKLCACGIPLSRSLSLSLFLSLSLCLSVVWLSCVKAACLKSQGIFWQHSQSPQMALSLHLTQSSRFLTQWRCILSPWISGMLPSACYCMCALGGGLPEAQQLRHSACCVQSSSANIRSRWRMEIKSHAAFRLLSLRQVARCLCRIPLGVFAASRLVSLHTLCRDRFPSRSVFPICFVFLTVTDLLRRCGVRR